MSANQDVLAGSEKIGENRRYPIGAEPIGACVSFRVWAPAQDSMTVVLDEGQTFDMRRQHDGYFQIEVDNLRPGALYRFKLGSCEKLAPDPASRFQPDGPTGPSMVVDPGDFDWHDHEWTGLSPGGQVLYEMHIGTFTAEGSYRAAAEKLPFLKELGITCLELMPVNEFCGSFGWGYDGVLAYAPTRLYGSPDDLRFFVETAHKHGIGVILDVVYNHFGAGDRFKDFSPDYFTDRYANEWGSSINFDGPNSAGAREYFAKNAAYWIDEFHFDGLRLDATQALFDEGDEHILEVIAREARRAGEGKSIYLVAENEPQQTRLVRSLEQGGYGLDALWNDDFHHSATVALTGRNEAYYHDHLGCAQEFVSAAKYGYLFQGQRYDWQDAPRGQPGFDLRPSAFVHFLQNHDQIANSGRGVRMDKLASPARVRAMTALLLLGPQTPMLFQGQEFGSSSPFFYFADQSGELANLVRNGRIDFLKQFPSLQDDSFVEWMPDPAQPSTFERSKLNWPEAEASGHVIALHRDLIALRQQTPAIAGNGDVDGSVLAQSAFLLRFFSPDPLDERLLIVNLGQDLPVMSRADPLLAAPSGTRWSVEWASEEFVYGGSGRRPIDLLHRWTLCADSAVLFRPVAAAPR